MNLTPSPNDTEKTSPSKRLTHKQAMRQIGVSLSPALIQKLDQAAAQEFTTRSEIIRTALLWYLRPQGRKLDQADPAVILDVLKRRKAKAASKQWLRDNTIEAYDTYDG